MIAALFACGVDNDVIFMGQAQAVRTAKDIFDIVYTCMDLTFKELDEQFKT